MVLHGKKNYYLPRSGTERVFHHINGALKLFGLFDVFFYIVPAYSIF